MTNLFLLYYVGFRKGGNGDKYLLHEGKLHNIVENVETCLAFGFLFFFKSTQTHKIVTPKTQEQCFGFKP